MKQLQPYQDVLPPGSIAVWPKVAAIAPAGSVLMGGTGLAIHLRHRRSGDLDLFTTSNFDPARLERQLRARGAFLTVSRGEGALDGVLDGVRVQFIWAEGQRTLEYPMMLAGMRVGSVADITATKLNAISGRAQLRDYFDLMCVEQQAKLPVERGFSLFMARYGIDHTHPAFRAAIRGLGHFDDIADDPGLLGEQGTGVRDRIVHYWTRRHPEVLSALDLPPR